MRDAQGMAAGSETLASAVAGVRWRWRLKHALHGAGVATVIIALAWFALALLMRASRYSDAMVVVARVVGAGVVLGAAWRWIVRQIGRAHV